MTVSKVLRDAPDISAATKSRIRVLSEQMGYMPDSAAQGLRNGTTKLFGLLISAVTNPIFARIVMAVEDRAHELGYEILFAHSLNRPEREEVCIRRLLMRRVDGIFLSPVYRMEPSSAIYQELARQRIPTVLLGHPAPFCAQFPSVGTDDIGASYTAAKHLTDLGHRRIAFLAGPLSAPSAQERLEGHRKAIREAGLETDDRLVFNAGNTIEEGEKAALQLLQENPSATAIQAVNDLVAIGAANVLLRQGLRIPADFSVVGFGNILLSEHFRVPLTTIRQPKLRLGVAAMESMLQLLTGENPGNRRLPGELAVRESTSRPRE